jgi:H+/Cl- antiporter ClcA
MKLLVPQDSTFSVWVLGVFCLHGLILGLLGVMFTSLLDLYRASLRDWSQRISLVSVGTNLNTDKN